MVRKVSLRVESVTHKAGRVVWKSAGNLKRKAEPFSSASLMFDIPVSRMEHTQSMSLDLAVAAWCFTTTGRLLASIVATIVPVSMEDVVQKAFDWAFVR